MRNELLGYLVDALETDDRAQVDIVLRNDQQLQGDLNLLQRALVPLEVDRHYLDPPAGLARRTIEFVFYRQMLDARAPAAEGAAVSRANPRWTDQPATSRRWRFADFSAAAGIVVAAFSVVVPALIQSKANAQRNSCQYNMQQAYAAITGYSGDHGGQLPGAQPSPGFEGKPGIYGPLISQAYLSDHRSLVCPGSDLEVEDFAIPSLDQLRRAKGIELKKMTRHMGGTYAFAVGYWDERGTYHKLSLRNGEHYPIMADLSGEKGKQIGHHGGCGSNVLMSDGVTKYLVTCRMATTGDNIYLNDDGEQDAGKRARDIVVLPSDNELRLFKSR